MRNVRRRLRVTLRLHVPFRSPVSTCAFHEASAPNSSGFSMSSRYASIFRSFIQRIRWYTLRAVFRIEPLQALVEEVPYFHRRTVTRSLTLVKADESAALQKAFFALRLRRVTRKGQYCSSLRHLAEPFRLISIGRNCSSREGQSRPLPNSQKPVSEKNSPRTATMHPIPPTPALPRARPAPPKTPASTH